MKRQTGYQLSLIGLGLLVSAFLLVFIYREIFPQYKEFQNRYVEMEEFRSSYTGDPTPLFEKGVKQIVLPQDDAGPEVIDRCISCHVALKFSHFSPTKIARDINGKMVIDDSGTPVLTKNENYVWGALNKKIAQLKKEGNEKEALALEKLKKGRVDGVTINMENALAMHPLLGKETEPFELHPMEEYGCTVCHSGNGRGITFKTAHGPIYDDLYHKANTGPHPEFTESDKENDPDFSKVFNGKPGHELLFQTTPVLVGSLMQATCVQCHQTTRSELLSVVEVADSVAEKKRLEVASIQEGFDNELASTIVNLQIKNWLTDQGYLKTIALLKEGLTNQEFSAAHLDQLSSRLRFLKKIASSTALKGTELDKEISDELQLVLLDSLGSEEKIKAFNSVLLSSQGTLQDVTFAFVRENKDEKKGSVYKKYRALQRADEAQGLLFAAKKPLDTLFRNEKFKSEYVTDSQKMLPDFERGKHLFFTNACYACHSIEGLSRGGVGPDLTAIGLSYPWYIKESIVWPQADLKTSTMPNFRLDHEELEDVMTFLLSQRGKDKIKTDVQRGVAIKEWQLGKQLPWEKPLPPTDIMDLNSSMFTYATEGCASCHKLSGFESNTGFSEEIKGGSPLLLAKDREWFYNTFKEKVEGSQLVRLIDKNKVFIDEKISGNVRKNSILEAIDLKNAQTVEGFYANFKFAMRAKNAIYEEVVAKSCSELERLEAKEKLDQWKNRVLKVRQIYIQEYGLGRDIAPRLNWSGVYNESSWLYGHFKNPEAYSPRSIMPVMPLDDSKFYGLIYMLRTLGVSNRDKLSALWERQGFDPKLAFELYCASCHGTKAHGNGPVAEWIYPIPKNLRDATFLRNLTKEKAIESVTLGVPGTPMPPWGKQIPKDELESNAPVLTKSEIKHLVDWVFNEVQSGGVLKEGEVLKWNYTPADVFKEMKDEGRFLKPALEEGGGKEASGKAVLYKGDVVSNSLSSSLINSLFQVDISKNNGVEKKEYFIKKKFYSEENISSGEKLFLLNCSHCHGNEAAGNGLRAEAMVDAKPRMLTNPRWLSKRDDLRLLRSIKFGVPGTAMTPWGDRISGVQRMQIVMFIRQIAFEGLWQGKLEDALFNVFNHSEMVLDRVRSHYYDNQENIQKEYDAAVLEKDKLYLSVKQGKLPSIVASEAYQKELVLLQRLQESRVFNQKVNGLVKELLSRRACFETAGKALIARALDEDVLNAFLKVISLNKGLYRYSEGVLEQVVYGEVDKIKFLVEEILRAIDSRVADLKYSEQVYSSQIRTADGMEKISDIREQITLFVNTRTMLIFQMSQSEQIREKERELYLELKKVSTTLSIDKKSPLLKEINPEGNNETYI